MSQMMQAEYEMELMTQLFNTLLDTCHQKCISPKYSEADMNKGESVCVDRCVSKYMAAFQQVGQRLNAQSQQPPPAQ